MKGRAGILLHPGVDRRIPVLAEARRLLEAAGMVVWEATRESRQPAMRDTRLLLTLGGDGTLLHGARWAAPSGIPVLGVNLGRLGFLTELEAGNVATGLERFLAGDYRLDERTLLAVHLRSGGRRQPAGLALNEVVVQRAGGDGLVRLDLAVDGQEVGTIDADGVLVATATGSTAYALAVGGPILDPAIEDLLMVPINPFALTVRPILFPPKRSLSIALPLNDGRIALDGGRSRPLKRGDTVLVAGYENRLRLVRFTPHERFYALLRQKLGWGLPLVPIPDPALEG